MMTPRDYSTQQQQQQQQRLQQNLSMFRCRGEEKPRKKNKKVNTTLPIGNGTTTVFFYVIIDINFPTATAETHTLA